MPAIPDCFGGVSINIEQAARHAVQWSRAPFCINFLWCTLVTAMTSEAGSLHHEPQSWAHTPTLQRTWQDSVVVQRHSDFKHFSSHEFFSDMVQLFNFKSNKGKWVLSTVSHTAVVVHSHNIQNVWFYAVICRKKQRFLNIEFQCKHSNCGILTTQV